MIDHNIYKSSKWINYPKPNRDAKLRLFCFPYAGSSGIVTYKYFADHVISDVEVCPIELPGRGIRLSEKMVDNLDEIVSILAAEILPHLDKSFAFFGHSMGALISFELTKKLQKEKKKIPQFLYLSAHRAPNITERELIFHKLSNSDLIEQLKKNDGMDEEILQYKELLDLVLPIIKNDYKVCETYKLKDYTKILCPITAFGGIHDPDVKEDDIKAWSIFTNAEFNYKMINGDHFFIIKEKENLIKILNQQLLLDLKKFVN